MGEDFTKMEMVELVEVVRGDECEVQHIQQDGSAESFDDLILTVVPGQEIPAGACLVRDPQTNAIIVAGVRNQIQEYHQVDVSQLKNHEVTALKQRVEQLEEQVHFLEDELRILHKKQGGSSSSSNYSNIRRTVFEVLRQQRLRISVSDFEDEHNEEYGRSRILGKKRVFENGLSDDDDIEDISEDEEEPSPPRKARRRFGPGRPSKKLAAGRKPKTNRIELTPPPPKISRPRGRPARRADDHNDNESRETISELTLAKSDEEFQDEKAEVQKPDEGITETDVAVEMNEADASNVGDEFMEHDKAEEKLEITVEETTEPVKETVTTEDPKIVPKKGRASRKQALAPTPQPDDEKEKELEIMLTTPGPLRVSTRVKRPSTRIE